MGKAAKAHRAKVQKRNKKVKQEEYSLKKKWNEAFEKQMEELKEKFAQMSGDTENNLNLDEVQKTDSEGQESTEPVSAN
jgi:hypothetical protein